MKTLCKDVKDGDVFRFALCRYYSERKYLADFSEMRVLDGWTIKDPHTAFRRRYRYGTRRTDNAKFYKAKNPTLGRGGISGYLPIVHGFCEVPSGKPLCSLLKQDAYIIILNGNKRLTPLGKR